MNKITLAQFQATRTECADLGAAMDDCMWEVRDGPTPGWIYADWLWIERRGDDSGWLILGRSEYEGTLAELEPVLYEWACGEGYCDTITIGGNTP